SPYSRGLGYVDKRQPSPFQVTDMAFHPVYGVLVNPRGQTPIYGNRNLPQTPEMSGYRNGSWTSYGVVRRNPAQANVLYNPTGLAIDPDSPEYVYMGSPRHGMLRVNLEDPEDILHMSGPNDPGKSLPGYVEAFPVMQAWPSVTSTLGAKFDADGNLWSYSFDLDRPGNDGMTALCWTPEARRASKDAASFQPWIRLHVPGVAASGSSRLLPLTHPNNRNLLLFAINTLKDRFVVLDHNGTPDDPSDDRMALVSEMRDHTGGVISNLTEHTRCMYEDPATGMVWIGTDLGPYMFNPRTMFVDPTRARRVLATDPATGTQSLLLDGLAINNIYSDTQGRKWFATMHDGLYCTSTDGSEILAHFTTDNSPIPADNVLTVCENIASGSMMVATAGGLSEFIPALTAGRPARTVAALPAAITPSYRGLVTIEGLIDGEEYFITDSAGEVVRRLGRPAAGCLQWDGHDDSGLPVPTGHYNVAGASGHALSSVRVLR
ncbi:MAG: hypothetical protein K2O24_08085, partial [Muribaculaceae bacterium]|nr:hypothetical protein [Muribaculaceae bacterium]